MSEYRISEQDYPAQIKTIINTSISILKDPAQAAGELSIVRVYGWPHYLLIAALMFIFGILTVLLTPAITVGIPFLVISCLISVAMLLYIGPWILQKVIGLFGKDWSFEDARYYTMLFQGIYLILQPVWVVLALGGESLSSIAMLVKLALGVLLIVQGLRFGRHYTGLGYGALLALILLYILAMAIPNMILGAVLVSAGGVTLPVA